eukprot:TRINITY_DN74196_c0_g1_i1.p1 TRINITY_DN74196_c0_g1~~TRINITY_DN74196_c0_g1_i1.p1  ORF type:complete len:591 (-),score=95.45 TRINITY_DN74196_c0_g1_i1:196-1968(-)
MAGLFENAPKPAAFACVGDWRSRSKTISIKERNGQLLLEMGPDAPVLALLSSSEGGEVWPMQWKAVWRHPIGEIPVAKDPLYIIELMTPLSSSLRVKRPIGTGVVEFVRVDAPKCSTSWALVKVSPTRHRNVDCSKSRLSRSRSRRSRSHSRSRSKSGSPKPVDVKGGVGHFLPGDWNCPKCGDHQFAKNPSCRSCGTPKPGTEDWSAKSGGGNGIFGGGGSFPGKPASIGREGVIFQIKRGQRESVKFKERWWEFCNKYGNGFYDPVRHETRFLEDFIEREKEGFSGLGKGNRSRSRSSSFKSWSRSSPTPRRSRSKSRSQAPRKERLGRSRRHGKGNEKDQKRRRRSLGHRQKRRRRHTDRRKKKKKRQARSRSTTHSRTGTYSRSRSRSGSSASLPSERPSRDAAVKVAEQEVRNAEDTLKQVREELLGQSAAASRKREEAVEEEIRAKVEAATKRAEEEFQAKYQQAEQKLQQEKMSRLQEAEQRLDRAIAARLTEANKRFRRDFELSADAAREDAVQTALQSTKERVNAVVAERVDACEERLTQAKERLATLLKKRDDGGATSQGSGSSRASSAGSDSEEAGSSR